MRALIKSKHCHVMKWMDFLCEKDRFFRLQKKEYVLYEQIITALKRQLRALPTNASTKLAFICSNPKMEKMKYVES